MAWTTPRTWVTAETPTAALLNTHIRDNSRELWRIIDTSDVGSASTPGNAGILAINGGTAVTALDQRLYSGRAIELEVHVERVYESATADGGWYLGINDANAGAVGVTPNVTIASALSGVLAHGRSGYVGSGVYSAILTPTAANHTYGLFLWSGNGTGSDSAVCENAFIVVWEKGS